MSDHTDIESDHELHPAPVAPQADQGVPAGEASRNQAQAHSEPKARK